MSFPTKLTNLSQTGFNRVIEKLDARLITWQSVETVH